VGRGRRWVPWTSWRSSGDSRFRREQLQKVDGAGARPQRGTTWQSTAQVDLK
ncbi:hypothetical protein NDU88_003042, partial [Pleurodeles waltl]